MTPNHDFNSLIKMLKDKEIKHHKLKIITLSKSILQNPEDSKLKQYLNQSLQRLEHLMIL